MAYFQFGLYDTLYSYSKINHNYFFPEKEQIRNKIALLYEKANISKKLPKKNSKNKPSLPWPNWNEPWPTLKM